MVRLDATKGQAIGFNTILKTTPKILKKDFGNPIAIALKKLNHNRMEFRNSNQQLK